MGRCGKLDLGAALSNLWPYFAALLPLGGVALGLWGGYALRLAEERHRARVQAFSGLAGLAEREAQLQRAHVRESINAAYWLTASRFLDDDVENAKRWAHEAETRAADALVRLVDLKGDLHEILAALRVLFPRAELNDAVAAVSRIGVISVPLGEAPMTSAGLNAWRDAGLQALETALTEKVSIPYHLLVNQVEKHVR